jgi:hypothetical protein
MKTIFKVLLILSIFALSFSCARAPEKQQFINHYLTIYNYQGNVIWEGPIHEVWCGTTSYSYQDSEGNYFSISNMQFKIKHLYETVKE